MNQKERIKKQLENEFIGKYGSMRLHFLEESYTKRLADLLDKEQLKKHLLDCDERCHDLSEEIVSEIAERNGITEELKSRDSLKWVQLINNAQASADEIIQAEEIYIYI